MSEPIPVRIRTHRIAAFEPAYVAVELTLDLPHGLDMSEDPAARRQSIAQR
jgi:hypothetical protein